jgi:hypothetical protein
MLLKPLAANVTKNICNKKIGTSFLIALSMLGAHDFNNSWNLDNNRALQRIRHSESTIDEHVAVTGASTEYGPMTAKPLPRRHAQLMAMLT